MLTPSQVRDEITWEAAKAQGEMYRRQVCCALMLLVETPPVTSVALQAAAAERALLNGGSPSSAAPSAPRESFAGHGDLTERYEDEEDESDYDSEEEEEEEGQGESELDEQEEADWAEVRWQLTLCIHGVLSRAAVDAGSGWSPPRDGGGNVSRRIGS